MREAVIMVPKADNSGKELPHVLDYAVRNACAGWGGATVSPAIGHWVSPSGQLFKEPMWALTVAMEDSAENRVNWRSLAFMIGRMAEQEAIYCRLPDGTVDIMSTAPAQEQAA